VREREVSWSVWAMEICREVLDSGDKRLQAKFKHALNVIDRTLALYKFEEVAFSFNGGKDSTVCCYFSTETMM
jgi:3'-phosphoadenosine 5'-phosphosulfate sulfotransferase (PAPS reductase)/FAD synthetase